MECEMAADCHYGSFMSLYIRLLYCEILGEHSLGCALGCAFVLRQGPMAWLPITKWYCHVLLIDEMCLG